MRDLICSLRNAGSRFLKLNGDNEWVEIGDKRALVKVREALARFKTKDEEVI